MVSAFTRADPGIVRFAYREHGATQDGFRINLSRFLSYGIALRSLLKTFNMANPKLSSPRENCLGKSEDLSSPSCSLPSIQHGDEDEASVGIESGKDFRDDCSVRKADRDVEKGWEEKMLREVGVSSPIFEIWKAFGSLRMGWVVLREVWRGRWET